MLVACRNVPDDLHRTLKRAQPVDAPLLTSDRKLGSARAFRGRVELV